MVFYLSSDAEHLAPLGYATLPLWKEAEEANVQSGA